MKKKGDKTLYYGLYFLGFVILLYIILYLLNPNSIYKPLNVSLNIFIQIIPVIIMVIVLMGFSNYFLKPKIILKYLGRESGTKGWILAIVFG
ncbi:MAG TPA: permease, partial [Thermoplasmatales archaeon]|nr:permease [Thermoplasmatales archaeon]